VQHGGLRRRRIDDSLWLVLHCLAVVLAAGLAVLILPDDPNPRGALALPGAVLATGLLLIPVIRGSRGFDEAIRGEHIVSLGLVYWLLLDLLQAAYEIDLADGTPALAFAAIALFSLGSHFGAAYRRRRTPRVLTREIEASLPARLIMLLALLCFVLGMFRYAFAADFNVEAMVRGLRAPRFDAPWSREALGDWNAFLDHLAYFGFVLPVLYVLAGRRRGWLSPLALVILALAIVFVAFSAQGGGRRIVGVIVGAGIVAWVALGRRVTPLRVLGLAIAVAGLLGFMQLMLGMRNVGLQEFASVRLPDVEYLHVDDNFYRLGQVIEIFPEVHDYVGLRLPLHVLMRPIPRALWNDKPVDGGFDLAHFLGMEGIGLSMSVVGELVTVFGLVAVLAGGIVYGLIAGLLNRLIPVSLATGNPVQIALLAMVLFVGVRSMYDLMVMSYAFMGWVLLRGLVSVLGSRWTHRANDGAAAANGTYAGGRWP